MVDRGARLGADGRLDDEVMLPYLREQRWFGAHEREVSSASLVDVVLLADDPVLEVALVDVHFEAGAHDLYQLLLRDEGGELFDATTDPDLGTRLVELASEQAERADGRGPALVQLHPAGASTRGPERARARRRAVEHGRGGGRSAREDLPPRARGREPRARHAALLRRARLPERARARRLVRLRGRARAGDARPAATVPPRCGRRVGAGHGGGARRAGRVPRPAAPPRRRGGGDARRARVRRLGSRVRARGTAAGERGPRDRAHRRGDRLHLRRAG